MNWTNDSIRQIERDSIRKFMEDNRGYLTKTVLDFGSGKQPYRDLVSGSYNPFERGELLDTKVKYDTVMCNQVIQYINNPLELLECFYGMLNDGGYLVMTGPTNWAEVEDSDLFRYTLSGIRHLLARAGFQILVIERRAEVDLNGFKFSLGWGIVATKNGNQRSHTDY